MSDFIVQVSENDVVLGGVSREIAHGEARTLHREVDVFLVNNYGILLDKRKDTGKWCQFGGHPEYYEDIEAAEDWKAAAIREFEEEAGYRFEDHELKEFINYIRRTEKQGRINHRFARVFLSTKDIPIEEFKPQKSEVEAIKYFKRAAFENLMRREDEVMGGLTYILTDCAPGLRKMIPY